MQLPNRNLLQSHLMKSFSFGNSYETAARQLLLRDEYRNYAAPDNVYRAFVDMCKSISEDYGPYNKIQYIMQSHILYHVDHGYYTYNDESKELRPLSFQETSRYMDKKALLPKLREIDFTYNPNSTAILTEGTPNWSFNTYRPANWYSDYFYNAKSPQASDVPDIYKRYLMNITDNNEASYNYILNWLSMALTDRNLTYLCTIAAEGIGKGRLYDLMKALFNETNCVKVFIEQLDSQFNGYLEGKKIVYLDEVLVNNSKKEDKIKEMVNPTIMIEKKGKDSYTANNYANIYISSNNTDALKISSANQRRFSLINLTEHSMSKWPHVYKNWSIDKDFAAILDPENVAALGQHLLTRTFDREQHRIVPFLSKEKTREIFNDSLKTWEHYMIFELAKIRAGNTITLIDLKEQLELGINEQCKKMVTQASLKSLCRRHPGIFALKQLKQVNGQRPICIEFAKLEEQEKSEGYDEREAG